MKLVCLTLSFLLAITAFSQKQTSIPDFGKIDKAELDMKECDFDKNAEAVVLFDDCEIYCSLFTNLVDPLSSEIEHHVRIKILNNKGLKYADIHIPYISYKAIENIKGISAQTYNLDASGNIVTTKVDKKLIYDRKVSRHFSERVFSFPEVKAGSVIEYKYKSVCATVKGLRKWYFQKEIPVRLSQYTINLPAEIEVLSQPRCSLPLDRKEFEKGDRSIKIYSMADVPALRDEAFISCDEDYLQQLESTISCLQKSQLISKNPFTQQKNILCSMSSIKSFTDYLQNR